MQIALDEGSFALEGTIGRQLREPRSHRVASHVLSACNTCSGNGGGRHCRFASAAGLDAEKRSNRWCILRWAAETLAESEARGLAA